MDTPSLLPRPPLGPDVDLKGYPPSVSGTRPLSTHPLPVGAPEPYTQCVQRVGISGRDPRTTSRRESQRDGEKRQRERQRERRGRVEEGGGRDPEIEVEGHTDGENPSQRQRESREPEAETMGRGYCTGALIRCQGSITYFGTESPTMLPRNIYSSGVSRLKVLFSNLTSYTHPE